jgi:hypothetical protein
MFGKKEPAVQMIEAFTAELDRKGVRYSANKEKKLVSITYDNDHYKNQAFTFFFDDDGASFYVRAYSIEQFTANQLSDAYEFCNRMNADYRWLTFYIDRDNELTARADSIANLKTMGPRGYEIYQRFFRIVEKVCEKLYA